MKPKNTRLIPAALLPVIVVALLGGCGGAGSAGTGRIEIQVTEDGFVPASVAVPAGRPVTLAVTRRTDRTCATELVMPALNIRRKLPLNRTVEITFTPAKPETLDYACAMNMVKGRVVVESSPAGAAPGAGHSRQE